MATAKTKPEEKPEVDEAAATSTDTTDTREAASTPFEGVKTVDVVTGEDVAAKPAERLAVDPADGGVPMVAGKDHGGPEDAYDPNARGDYSARLNGEGPHLRTEPIPLDEQVKDGPKFRTVPQLAE